MEYSTFLFQPGKEGEEGKRLEWEGKRRARMMHFAFRMDKHDEAHKQTQTFRIDDPESGTISHRARVMAARRPCCGAHDCDGYLLCPMLLLKPSQRKESSKPPLKFPVLRPGLFQMFKLQQWEAHSLLDICPVLPIYDASIFKKTGGPS